jgi:head-tail adaptor
MLDNDTLDAMREQIVAALPDTGTVSRRTRVADGGGGYTFTWADHHTVPCRIAPVAGGEQGVAPGGRAADETTHVATVPAGADVSVQDRLRVSGQTYDVLLVRRRGSWELSRRVELKEAP